MSEQMMTDEQRGEFESLYTMLKARAVDADVWATVARLYREYGTEDEATMGREYTLGSDPGLSDEANAAVREVFNAVNETPPHYHVVEFINGCLNDYDSGPIATIEDAREELYTLMRNVNAGYEQRDDDDNATYVPAGDDRYERGLYILKIETCNEACDPDADY